MAFARVPGLVSVVIPCYNASPYITDCLNSIAEQTYSNLQIVLVNDGSTDHSLSEIRSWLQRETAAKRFLERGRFLLTDLPVNIGYSGANTVGLYMAQGEFIALQDADDLSHPERIAKQVDFLLKHGDISLVGTNIAEFRTNRPEVKAVPKWIRYGHEQIKARYDQGSAGACYGSLLFRGDVFDEMGGLVRNLPWKKAITGHDSRFIAKCLNHGYKIDNTPQVLYYYRLHPKQMSGRGQI